MSNHLKSFYAEYPALFDSVYDNRLAYMDREALPLYDVSAMHHRWKDEFTPLLEKKAIFDHES